ncbi:glycogen-binding subunit 76A [Teleopsis dalmanni]|uniref:glycogen-binding subunit 76A n=1 Tax=Teleopsis dalmanni TaxID=139649 RepID=UPI0018CE5B16|nr:glycogen-binding subunit 76A [Teleopsis dalmanni]XP_037935885.1 glycogen-binding subunit 76A [Teleopsis dalmanni]XP_037935887.1 glycogen-binding subunit 76A [Teleopsis dalmanni]XP_037935888.1 glycogen-binding subunit 76A [Teleopsis dalmanni]
MNGPGDIPLTHSSTPDTRPCSLISIIPTLGMSSCRGRAEAFARRLSSKLRTLGSQTDDDPTSQEDEPIINGNVNNTWISSHDKDQTVTDLQPLRHESDSFFDFDCELESPGSPVDECEYLRLIETASNTPHNSVAESGYVCASAASSHSSTDAPYFDIVNADNTVETQQPTHTKLTEQELSDFVHSPKINGSDERLSNGHDEHDLDNNDIENYHHYSAQDETKGQNEEILALPTTGLDDTTLLPPVKSPDKLATEATTQELKRMQNDIINELQKQSEQYNEENKAANENGQIQHTSTTENGQSEQLDELASNGNVNETIPVLTTISNGLNEEGEEVLKIELTEVDNALQIQSETKTEQFKNLTEEIQESTQELKATQEEESKESPTKNKQSTHILDTTDDEDDCRPQRVRRCSSLKTGKTPPGTPGRKKIVRFADVLGLDLADVKTFLDEIPTIPKSAYEDLEILESEPPIQLGPKSDKLLMPLFQQPGGLPRFLDIVREKQVSLENAAVTDHINQTITGSVRVRNLDFHKSVHIRYSLDGWRSFADLQANYVENSCDGFSDKFSFILFGNTLHIGQRLELAVRFQCKGQQFWDNNYGANYCFQCLPTSTPGSNPITPIVATHHSTHIVGLLSPTAGDAWCSSFY